VSGSFSLDWLTLREAADADARSAVVTESIISVLRARDHVRVLDLGCGSGSNMRYLARRLSNADWHLVDHDPLLLAAARTSTDSRVTTSVADLQTVDARLIDGCDLVTASALLDLVSESWLASLVRRCRANRSHVLFALNYDGRVRCWPEEPFDSSMRDLVNRHQRTDKGFGPAMGPDSGALAAAMLSNAGYQVQRAESDWQLGSGHSELQRQLIAGWAEAALEIAPVHAEDIRAWARQRQAHVLAGTSQILVGHDDIAGALRV
jgi:SAM-dependent methyltransferase